MIPDGEVLEVRYGLRIRHFADRMYAEPFVFGDYEPALTRAFRRYIAAGEAVVDVGTNFGWYSCVLGDAVGHAGTVHGFEPVPHLAELARENISLNRLEERVSLNEIALGERDGTLTVYTFAGLPHGHASSSALGRDDAEPWSCAVMRLDDYLDEARTAEVSLLKVDVEGFEIDVLRGAPKLLSSDRAPVVAFEVNPDCLEHRDVGADEVGALLREAGYTEFWRVPPRGRAVLAADPLPDTHADYVAAKPARAPRLRRALGVRR